ncbi:3-hydroxyacyl-ACP dehydratase FabZ [Silvimonas amylolytica]|uniref:3-hydroxyacyl-[acyl-carrier-protein] dehydratase FabZ n=2 Tax=Silvimonas amylolytica TaxID=449663 RepID=A0ABQ2PHP1_9NEIS|nr:3-hydroxyacyl-ACP dehydratase FabZ [Silvimonas amylolytica]GGP24494.1 3-hydroxyacyl-[acyl-carrier-protein] dehydratase FabZ [Silvimonas amylolytica]
MSETMDINDIVKYLPHRYPFLLVDRVVELELGKSIKAIKNVTINEPFFQGHFPGYPVMPGVLIMEALAQAAGVLSFKSEGRMPSDGTLYFFAGIDNARFKRQVLPGDQLTLCVEMVAQKRGIYKYQAKAYVGDELAAEADLMCAERKVNK